MSNPFGKVVYTKGARTNAAGAAQPFTYLLFEDVIDAFNTIRKGNTHGYQYDVYWNRPFKAGTPGFPQDNGKKATSGAITPYIVKNPNGSMQKWGLDAGLRTNCSSTTVNACAIALSHGDRKVIGTGAAAVAWAVPLVGGDVMPVDFYAFWQLWDTVTSKPEWWHGAQRSILNSNVGDSVFGTVVRRGDVIQISWADWNAATPLQKKDPQSGTPLTNPDGSPLMETQQEASNRVKGRGHSVFCYHSRKISNQETRFLILSSQPDTFGVGVRMNPWSLSGLPTTNEYTNLGGGPKKRWVDHQESFAQGFESPEFAKHAITHGLWYVTSDADDVGSAVSKDGAYYRAHVARPRRPFPCFPISVKKLRTPAFLKHKDFTAGIASGEVQGAPDFTTAKDAFQAYYDNNEQGDAGFYPVGADRTWHTGVHLYPEDDKLVYAPFDGRVVCARFAPPDKDKWVHGSGNFVLLKHALEIDGTLQEFYTLLMHLEQTVPESDPKKADARLAFPWLRDVVLALPPNAPEYSMLDAKKLHLQVLKVPPGGVTFGNEAVQPGDIFELDPDEKSGGKYVGIRGWMHTDSFTKPHVTRVANGTGEGAAPTAGDGKTGVLNWNKFREGDVVVFDGFPRKFADKKKKLDAGEVVDFWDDEIYVGAGEPIGRVGQVEGEEGIHFEVFSASFIKCWTDKVDCESNDPKMFADRKTFSETFWKKLGQARQELADIEQHIMGSNAHQSDKHITRSEIVEFYNENADRYHFRDLVVKCPSAWSEAAKWHEFDQNAKASFGWLSAAWLTEKKEQIDPYVFWKKGASAGLPSDMQVVHYHPMRFLEWVNALREKEAPGSAGDKLHVSVYEKNQRATP